MSIGALLSLAGCGGEVSTLDPSGPAAASISLMWSVMLVGATLVLLLVMVLLAMGLSGRAREASQTLWLGWGGLGFAGTVLLALLAYGFVVGEALKPSTHPDVVRVRATAEQWQWRFAYGSGRADTDGLLVIPAGRPVTVAVTSRDVIHSFWVPRLAGKIDAIPGHVNRLMLHASQPGTYAGLCAEFCGIGHRSHNFGVIALAPPAWEAFIGGGPVPDLAEDRFGD
jgi:heme/copper-type cytochrome/quinol oxidase subunit 2